MEKSYKERINSNHEIKLYQKNLCTIFQFYVVESPTYKGNSKEPVSARGNLFDFYGWVNINSFKSLKRSLLQACQDIIYHECNNYGQMTSWAEKYFPPTEYCIFIKNNAEINSLLYYIRNAFAHGNFYQFTYSGKKIYFLRSVRNGTLKAEMALSEQTLLKWIEIIKAGP